MVALSTIHAPEKNAVILRRPLPPSLSSAAAERLEVRAPPLLLDLPPAPDRVELAAWLSSPALAQDLAFWVEVLADLTEAESVGVRLARLERAMCPRFHFDRVALRLVLTYAGRGTELVAHEDVDRRRLGHAAAGQTDETSGLLAPSARIHRAQAGDVVLLKGEGWPGNQGRGAVHRSPAATPAAPRLVLTLDPL